MGTSYIKFKEFGFWSRDSVISEWIETLLGEIGRLPEQELWTNTLSEHWRIQADIDGGCIDLQLDEFCADDFYRVALLTMAQKGLQRSSEASRRTGELFIALLSGQLLTTASSDIDYL